MKEQKSPHEEMVLKKFPDAVAEHGELTGMWYILAEGGRVLALGRTAVAAWQQAAYNIGIR